MSKKELPKRAFIHKQNKYPWAELVTKGDFFELPKADQAESRSCRISGIRKGFKLSVWKMDKGGYCVELLEDRPQK